MASGGPGTRVRGVLLALLCAAGLMLCGRPAQAAPPRAGVALVGAGSTFVAPLLVGQWIPGYLIQHPEVTATYHAVGSSAGLQQWLAGTADFAASDVPMDAGQQRQAQGRCGGAATTIPATIGAVALIYNVPGVPAGLRFSPGLLAAIFLGRVASWSDPSIKALNPGMRLPDLPIQVVHRSNGSGTTYILTSYLAEVSTPWRTGPGSGATVTWPVGTGVKGSAGIVQQVSTTLGALGYVDLAYAVQDNLTYARIENAHGEFVSPGVEAASEAAAWLAGSMPADLQQIITNAAAPRAYPIAGYSYLILCARQSGAKGRAAVDFVRYAVTDGQETVRTLYYAPLPPSVERMDTAALDRIAVMP